MQINSVACYIFLEGGWGLEFRINCVFATGVLATAFLTEA